MKFLGIAVGAVAGAVAGFAAGVLLAPRSGAESRAMASDAMNDAWDSAVDAYERGSRVVSDKVGSVRPSVDATSDELRVSMQDHGSDIDQYVFTITNEMIDSHLRKYNTSLKDMLLAPVTTNDGSNFTYQHGQKANPNDKDDPSYLEVECYFIATREMWVHLTTESFDTQEGNKTLTTQACDGCKQRTYQVGKHQGLRLCRREV